MSKELSVICEAWDAHVLVEDFDLDSYTKVGPRIKDTPTTVNIGSTAAPTSSVVTNVPVNVPVETKKISKIGGGVGAAAGTGIGAFAGKRLLLGNGEVRAAIKDAIISSKSPAEAATKLSGLNSKKALAYANIVKQNAKNPNWKNKVLRKMSWNSALAVGGGGIVGGTAGAIAGSEIGKHYNLA